MTVNLLETFERVAKDAVKRFPNCDDATIELLNYSENSTYLVRRPDGTKSILRVCRPGYHSKEEIQGEITWLQSIAEKTPIEVAMPILGKDGEYVQAVALDDFDQPFNCVMFAFLEGEMPNVDDEVKLAQVFEKIGEITAILHQHSIDHWDTFQTTIRRHTWDYETILGEAPKWGRWQDGKGITPERAELYGRVSEIIRRRLERYGKGRDRFGLIHADLRHANLLVHNDRVKLIDFDDCGYGWYMYDLATSLTFIEDRPYVPDLIASWLKGYRKVRPLSEEEEQEIQTFIMMRRLQLIAWIGSRDNETTRELGSKYTEDTDPMAIKYLETYGK